ncbi:hypothetical protein HK097_009037 [Rhizophlyctis rosea]|uniref:Syntaxin n=1 Tax=Rhizophlyctis rosea TaxID=64517 RepID=A0AAD5SHX6_9FUNG|nr:hypothetical protein HK097_009037 [Rhizophlyctis rosea]
MEPVSKIRITQTEQRTHPSTHVAYQLSLQGPVRSWTVWRRYSDFDTLHKSFLSLFHPLPPPAHLPPKSTFPFLSATGNDPVKIEERRRGLESYAQSILYDKDPRWRRSKEWMDFIGLPESDRRNIGLGTDNPIIGGLAAPAFTPESWMEEYRALQSLSQQIRSYANTRDRQASSGDISGAQSSTVQARKALTSLESRLSTLEDFLKHEESKSHTISHAIGSITHALHLSSDSPSSTTTDPTLSTGEIRRRHDLVTNLHENIKALHHIFSSSASTTPSSSNTNLSPHSNSYTTSSTSDRTALLGGPSPRTTRRFGTSHSLETDQTRPLDNSGLVQLQRQQMEDQDSSLDALSSIIRRQKQIGMAIGNELDVQNHLLGELDEGVDRTKRNLANVGKKLDRVSKG